MRIALMALVALQFMAVVLVSAVGLFADGGDFFERALFAAVHPLAAAALAATLALENPARRLVILALALALANIAADAYISLAIFTGAIRGDAWLPMAFAVIPTAAGAYLWARLARNRA